MDNEAILGSCLCGSFQFEVTGSLGEVRLCHCDLCRKANGSAYSANSRVPLARFRVVSQANPITAFESSPGAWKHFCSVCGSPAYSTVDRDPDHIRIRLGTLPRNTSAKVTGHVWVGSMAAWDCICDDLPKFERTVDAG